jgi:hypothetical protein
MKCNYACRSNEHEIARRGFLGTMLGTAGVVGGLGAFTNPSIATELERKQKRVVVFNMAGGISQLETWDPKQFRHRCQVSTSQNYYPKQLS